MELYISLKMDWHKRTYNGWYANKQKNSWIHVLGRINPFKQCNKCIFWFPMKYFNRNYIFRNYIHSRQNRYLIFSENYGLGSWETRQRPRDWLQSFQYIYIPPSTLKYTLTKYDIITHNFKVHRYSLKLYRFFQKWQFQIRFFLAFKWSGRFQTNLQTFFSRFNCLKTKISTRYHLINGKRLWKLQLICRENWCKFSYTPRKYKKNKIK